MHVWLLLNWLLMYCQQSYPLVGFHTSTKSFLYSLVWKCVSRSSRADVSLISPRKANRAALAVLRLIRCLKTYLLFWWSEEWIADVSLKVLCGLSLSSIYKRTRAALKSIRWMLRGWETLLYSILYHSSYITQTATELKHSEGAIFIQLCLLHWGRLDVSAFKSLCELFIRSWDRFIEEGCCGINVNPRSDLPMPFGPCFV